MCSGNRTAPRRSRTRPPMTPEPIRGPGHAADRTTEPRSRRRDSLAEGLQARHEAMVNGLVVGCARGRSGLPLPQAMKPGLCHEENLRKSECGPRRSHGECETPACRARPPTREPQNTRTFTALLVLPWNAEEPRYWALNVKLPGPKNATVNVASATPFTTRTVARPRTWPLTIRSTVPSGGTVPEAGLMMAVKVTVGTPNRLVGLTWACSVVVVPMRLLGGAGKIDSSWSLRSATSCTRKPSRRT